MRARQFPIGGIGTIVGPLLGAALIVPSVASAIAWLLDPQCLMTGQLMVVDGGFTLGRPPSAAGAK